MTVSDLSAVKQPVQVARGLPNEHYIDQSVFEEERDAVLFANWSAIGFGKDIPNEGDANPVDFLGMPLLILRDHAGQIRVYQNTCRHRGMILVSEKSNIRGTIRCPYHSWCYALDGRLRSTPHVGGPGQNLHDNINRKELGLIEIPSHVYMDVVFVNISGNAEPFEIANAAVLERWQEFDKPIYSAGEDSCFNLTVKSNWKLAVENYCESYHLPWVHPGLNVVSKLEDHYHLEERQKFSGQGSVVYTQLKDNNGRCFKDFDDLSAKWDTGSEYISFFPNVLFGVHRDHTYAIILEPVSLDRTVEHVSIYYAKPECTGDDYADLRTTNTAFWKEVFEEDIFVVEGMQKGRHGRFFDGGKFAPAMDGPTHLFHEWVATQVDNHRENRA
ncbi:(2Fe-2S)-binding protein [Amylibacter kogurei]|uniref:(2Fe-2S)-binding protein n=1 Tax=Paramylibacter kogurei TaxID=1889778 RepID=A0A2G5KA48_9RHOB|nr:aromatic ring-hydroxylating dioxygenase subunit alpha [Amylibacter kogurei]PIB25893.1 (2Fe-2S)-binding protein [Amylibacter kogurei]